MFNRQHKELVMQYHTEHLRTCRRTIGANLKNIRLSKNLSLEEFSEQSGMNLVHIHKLEKGKTAPTVETLFRLACSLDISLERLFKGAGPFA